VTGTFVDGGVSPFNNPALQAFMYATLCGYRVNWTARADRLLLVSLGTGASDPSQAPSRIAATGAIRALFGLIDDCGSLVETIMQWVSRSVTAREIDRELEECSDDLLSESPRLSYLRYNVSLSPAGVNELLPGLPAEQVASLGEMDNPDNLEVLLRLGEAGGRREISADHFPATFDLAPLADPGRKRRKYLKRPDQPVVAVQVALEGLGFTYQKWGATQQCKAGDWLVDNDGEVYTVDKDSFDRTYQKVDVGKYVKTTPIWAEVAESDGQVHTKEGSTSYKAGDYLVFNEESGGDSYAIEPAKFEAMYERAD
jgi:hypothetical protein